MMWRCLLAGAGLASTALAAATTNKCFQEIVGNKEGRADCDRFLSTTTTLPCFGSTVTVTAPPITVICTETRTINVSATVTTGVVEITTTRTSIIETTPIQEAVTTATIFATGTLTNYQTTTLVTIYAPTGQYGHSFAYAKENVAETTGSTPPLPKLIPIYASDCNGYAQYSYECRCAGATIEITTVAPTAGNANTTTTVTPTITDKVYVTRTNTETIVDASSTKISTQLVGEVSFVSTKTFTYTFDTTVTTDVATETGGTRTETTTAVPTFHTFAI